MILYILLDNELRHADNYEQKDALKKEKVFLHWVYFILSN